MITSKHTLECRTRRGCCNLLYFMRACWRAAESGTELCLIYSTIVVSHSPATGACWTQLQKRRVRNDQRILLSCSSISNLDTLYTVHHTSHVWITNSERDARRGACLLGAVDELERSESLTMRVMIVSTRSASTPSAHPPPTRPFLSSSRALVNPRWPSTSRVSPQRRRAAGPASSSRTYSLSFDPHRTRCRSLIRPRSLSWLAQHRLVLRRPLISHRAALHPLSDLPHRVPWCATSCCLICWRS